MRCCFAFRYRKFWPLSVTKTEFYLPELNIALAGNEFAFHRKLIRLLRLGVVCSHSLLYSSVHYKYNSYIYSGGPRLSAAGKPFPNCISEPLKRRGGNGVT